MKTRYIHTTIKMTLASVISILIAFALNLEYAITSGILAVLSVQLTRSDSLLIAGKRLSSGTIGLILSSVLFVILGYQVWVFALFTALFIAVSFALKISEGIVPSLVLVSHLLIHGVWQFSLVINGFLLITIAIIVALTLNQLYPLKTWHALLSKRDMMDCLIKSDLLNLSDAIKTVNHSEQMRKHDAIFFKLEALLKETEIVYKDILFNKDRQLISYIRMRRAQMNHIDRMFKLVKHIHIHHAYAETMSTYVYQLSHDIGQVDKATPQKILLDELLESFRKKPLPDTRDAFEVRALLYQILFELESFLEEKIKFHESYK